MDPLNAPAETEPIGEIVATVGTTPVVLLDSISYVTERTEGMIVVSGSHGGTAAGRYALAHPPRLAVFNDAGVGKDRAGVVALDMLAGVEIAAVAVSHTSARIGDGADTWKSGVISATNGPAADLGLEPGWGLRSAVLDLEWA
jgi:hypothetical protein